MDWNGVQSATTAYPGDIASQTKLQAMAEHIKGSQLNSASVEPPSPLSLRASRIEDTAAQVTQLCEVLAQRIGFGPVEAVVNQSAYKDTVPGISQAMVRIEGSLNRALEALRRAHEAI